jgi:hypothetical protein
MTFGIDGPERLRAGPVTDDHPTIGAYPDVRAVRLGASIRGWAVLPIGPIRLPL